MNIHNIKKYYNKMSVVPPRLQPSQITHWLILRLSTIRVELYLFIEEPLNTNF